VVTFTVLLMVLTTSIMHVWTGVLVCACSFGHTFDRWPCSLQKKQHPSCMRHCLLLSVICWPCPWPWTILMSMASGSHCLCRSWYALCGWKRVGAFPSRWPLHCCCMPSADARCPPRVPPLQSSLNVCFSTHTSVAAAPAYFRL
jgi:hypothetical protein